MAPEAGIGSAAGPLACHMRYSDSDLLGATDEQLDRLGEEDLLRLVVICRDGDQRSTRKAGTAWQTLVAHDIERVRRIVETFRHPENPDVRVAHGDVDEVVQDAFIRLLKMLGGFRGSTIGEYRSAMWTCVRYVCMDYCREQMAKDKQRAGSLGEEIGGAEGDTRPRYEREIAERERRRIENEEALEREVERLREHRWRLDEVIAQVDDEPKRRVLEMTRKGRSTKQIAKALDTSEANVYQLRTRALKQVARILSGDDDS
jgi:RNA polymerase sigma factor (sigma-70 family)